MPKRREICSGTTRRDHPGVSFAAAVAAIGENFRAAFSLRCQGRKGNIATALDLNALPHKIHRALGAVRGNDYPAARDGVLAKFRQTFLLGRSRATGSP